MSSNKKTLRFFLLFLIVGGSFCFISTNKVKAADVINATSGFWTRANGTLSPVTSTDNLSLNGNVGIGTTAPSAKLSVGGTGGSTYTIYGANSASGVAVYGDASTGSGYGIEGRTESGYGVYGAATNGTATGTGGYFTSSSGFALITGNGYVGIGTNTPNYKLDIAGNQSSNSITRILNNNSSTTADGLVIKLGNSSTTTVSTNNHFINFETAGIGNVGSIRGNGAKGVQYVTSGPADFAEYFPKDEKENIEFGSLVCIGNNANATLCDSNNSNILGVASEKPSFVGGDNLGNKSIAVALVGQVLLKVKGEVKIGDPLTFSDIPGIAIKATENGPTVGRALQSHSGSNTDKILMVVSPSWFTPNP